MEREKEEIIIEEFKTSPKKNENSHKPQEYQNFILPVAFCITFLVAVLAGMFWLKLSVVLVCVILVLESLIGVCLHDTPVWVHGMEIVISVVAGIIFGQPVFMIIAAAIYVATILALHYMRQ